jgi:hypothetical protein
MATVEYEDEGWADFVAELSTDSVSRGMDAVKAAAMHMEGKVKEKLAGQRTGRVYRVPDTQREYTASAPGEPPAVMFGDLRKAVTHQGPTVEGQEVNARVGVDGQIVPYARRLELGYRDTDARGRTYNMAARPYLRSTFVEQQAAVDALMRQEINR